MQLASGASPSLVSIVIPTFNGGSRIGNCLDALLSQVPNRPLEIIVVNDGSTDNTVQLVQSYAGVRLLNQINSGPATARNRGALAAQGSIVAFTDDDCVPTQDWLEALLFAFHEPDVVGVKGVYRTRQKSLAARFVQIEYEDRYRMMSRFSYIDFVDTYSAAFRRDRFLEMNGYDTSFPVACAEDVELSYRMSARGWKMKFAPSAIVYHTHPDTLTRYLRKKYKFAFWRMLAVRKNPGKAISDSHTPQLMKVQLAFGPALLFAFVFDAIVRTRVPVSAMVLILFLLSTLSFVTQTIRRDFAVGLISPVLLAARACAQALGVAAGMVFVWRKHEVVATRSST